VKEAALEKDKTKTKANIFEKCAALGACRSGYVAATRGGVGTATGVCARSPLTVLHSSFSKKQHPMDQHK
jgi:hypothetical protein